VTHFFSEHLLMRALVSFKDIVGDDANSLVVEQRHQAVFAAGLAYYF
jgi:outer membrane scaffolding protein for murein synthesis (MipA/OmpV family)